MKKNPDSQSGIFTPRVLAAFLLCSAGVLLAMFGFAGTPPTGKTMPVLKTPGNSLFVDSYFQSVSGTAKAGAARMQQAPASTGSWSIVTSPNGASTQANGINA